MKKGVSIILKNILSLLSSKSLAIKSKAEAIKARALIFSFKHKKLHLMLRTGSISHKIHALLLGSKDNEEAAIVDDEHIIDGSYCYYDEDDDDDDDDKYPDLRHSLFDEEDMDLGDPNASAIEMVKNAKEDDGGDFSLEDEIDQVADLFILKFHKRVRLQKLESFKRYQDMLERST